MSAEVASGAGQQKTALDLLLLGDNQFFGINHMSEDKARAQAIRFQDLSAVIEVLDIAFENDIRTFMCTTHERIEKIADHLRANPETYAGYRLYPCMPYAHKYANAVTDRGMLGALRAFLPDEGFADAAMRGGRSLIRKDIEGVISLLVDAEMKMFRGLSTPVIFLQNVVVDLLLGLRFHEAFAIFDRHVRQRYGAEPGYITMNLPLLLDTLTRVEIQNPIVCANINELGFRMAGGIDAYERALAERPFRPIAMSVFASGAIPPRRALRWIHDHAQVESIVFGASSRTSIESTVGIVTEFWRDGSTRYTA